MKCVQSRLAAHTQDRLSRRSGINETEGLPRQYGGLILETFIFFHGLIYQLVGYAKFIGLYTLVFMTLIVDKC